MTLLVMCDGGPASIKAIGWAAVPGYLMKQHDGDQLILVHVWSRDSLQKTVGSEDSPERQSWVVEDMTALRNHSPSFVLGKTLEAITENKFMRDSLNYKLETMILSDSAAAAPRPASLPAPTTLTPQVQTLPKSLLASKKSAMVEQQQQHPVLLTEEELEAAAQEAARCRANAIAQYARERVLHHKAEAVLLGCGNIIEGKSILVGRVGRAVLSTMRQTHTLWFIKSNGHTMRPNTAVMRYVVVLVPRAGVEEERKGENENENENENGEEEEKEKEEEEDDDLVRDCRVVQYALGLCRENRDDTVSAVVVAESRTPPKKVERYTQALHSLFRQAMPVLAVADSNGDEGEADIPPALVAGEEAETAVGTTSDEVAAVASDAAAGAAAAAATATATATEERDEAPEEPQCPKVSVCQLRPTKQVANPTVTNASGQVVKFLQRHNTHVIVTPSTNPEELHLAFFSMSKQHVLVVPSAEPASCAETVGGDAGSPILEIVCTE